MPTVLRSLSQNLQLSPNLAALQAPWKDPAELGGDDENQLADQPIGQRNTLIKLANSAKRPRDQVPTNANRSLCTGTASASAGARAANALIGVGPQETDLAINIYNQDEVCCSDDDEEILALNGHAPPANPRGPFNAGTPGLIPPASAPNHQTTAVQAAAATPPPFLPAFPTGGNMSSGKLYIDVQNHIF